MHNRRTDVQPQLQAQLQLLPVAREAVRHAGHATPVRPAQEWLVPQELAVGAAPLCGGMRKPPTAGCTDSACTVPKSAALPCCCQHPPQDLGKALPRVATVQKQRQLQLLRQLDLGGKPALLHVLRPGKGRTAGRMVGKGFPMKSAGQKASLLRMHAGEHARLWCVSEGMPQSLTKTCG